MVVLLYGFLHAQQCSLIVPAVKAKLVQQTGAGFVYQKAALGDQGAAPADAVQYIVVGFHDIDAALAQCGDERCRRRVHIGRTGAIPHKSHEIVGILFIGFLAAFLAAIPSVYTCQLPP